MNSLEDNVRYYMPLNKGMPKDGPTTSVFSVPRIKYSPETQAVVKNLMRESRLTFTQKHVFETILRDGKALPTNPAQIMRSRFRQAYMQERHKLRASQMGIPIIEDDLNKGPFRSHANSVTMPLIPGVPSRRSLDTIKASGDLKPSPLPHFCRSVNKDEEKDRLVHKMAFGKDMTSSPFSFQQPDKVVDQHSKSTDKKQKSVTVTDLQQQRVEELIDEIQDRVQFLLTMHTEKKAKEYKTCIMSQINEKLNEMKKISPSKADEIRECLHVDLLERRLTAPHPNEHRSSKFGN